MTCAYNPSAWGLLLISEPQANERPYYLKTGVGGGVLEEEQHSKFLLASTYTHLRTHKCMSTQNEWTHIHKNNFLKFLKVYLSLKMVSTIEFYTLNKKSF